MKKTLTLLLSTAAFGLAASAYAADAEVKSKVEYKKNGGYEANRTAERTTSNGTAVASETDVDVNVDSKGLVDKTVKVENKSDPKGLGNAKTEKSETRFEEKERGGYKQVTTRKSNDANGTNSTYETTTDVNVDAAGNVTTTATTEKVENPKGLLNQKTSTSKVKSVNGAIVDSKKKSD